MTETLETGPQRECDLVMKGGITSGVVYPTAIRKIAAEYRFRNLGGASAGAIAAVAAAACEFRRNDGVPDAFDSLQAVSTEISQEGFVESLFQPRPKARPAFEVALSAATSSGSMRSRLTQAAVSILRVRRRFLIGATAAVLGWAAVIAIAIWALGSGGVSSLELVAIVLLALVALPLAALVLATIAAVALLHFVEELNDALKQTWFGMCTGRTEAGNPEDFGLTDWLYTTIQRCAGLPDDRPLTFALLRGDDEKDPLVNLQLVATDLSSSRPVILPFSEPEHEETPYLFDPDEWRRLFPDPVVEQMLSASADVGPPVQHGSSTLYPVPGLELPIVVAARLSLSFPILLATVPLWRADGIGGEIVQHTMSDGGICSNFPIHFFDSLFPGRPTFGLDLQPWRLDTKEPVEMSNEPRKPGFSETDGVGTFFTQILNAARNWRDNMQAELPGYRDRICQIRLTADEGGLNLNMPAEVVRHLIELGERAGAEVTSPKRFDWDRHRVTRFQVLMQMLQRNLGPLGVGRPGVYTGVHPGRDPFRDVVEHWRASQEGPEPPPLAWWEKAITASDAVFGLPEKWAAEGEVDFDVDAPTPTPTLRILPRI